MNRGTYSGNIAEIELVKMFNSDKNNEKFIDYLNDFKYDNIETIFMVRVTTKQYSKLSNQRVMTRADAYLIESKDQKLVDVLLKNNNYLDEEILECENINYKHIEFSGISIKMSDSSKFQILKLTPDSFYKLFNEYELGAAASIYCKKVEELNKNDLVCSGWHTSKQKIIEKYSKDVPALLYLNKSLSKFDELTIYKKLKFFSNNRIAEIIENDKHMQEIIFNGYYIYEEPYCASYFYKGDKIKKLNYIPFCVTTGSGRSKGDFTIVLKPKKWNYRVSFFIISTKALEICSIIGTTTLFPICLYAWEPFPIL